MSRSLHPVLAAYIEASNDRDAESFVACFSPEAVVVDEGETYRGSKEIHQWFTKTQEAYAYTLGALELAEEGRETVLTCRVTGAFPGSPVDCSFSFTLEGDRIVGLTIRS